MLQVILHALLVHRVSILLLGEPTVRMHAPIVLVVNILRKLVQAAQTLASVVQPGTIHLKVREHVRPVSPANSWQEIQTHAHHVLLAQRHLLLLHWI